MVLPTGTELINPNEVLSQAKIREGMRVVDLGCGTIGHFVFPASRLVGSSGKVYAVDIQKSVLNVLEGRVKMEGSKNIEIIWGDIERPRGVKISDGAVDVALLVNNLFLAKDRIKMGQEALRVLKSGGRLIIVDWKPAGAPFGPAPASRVSQEDVRLAMQSAGFMFMSEFKDGPYHYGLIFEKP